MNKVYVIIASRGEYSDREEWVCGVFTDEDQAREMVVTKSAEARVEHEKNVRWYTTREKIEKDPKGEFTLTLEQLGVRWKFDLPDETRKIYHERLDRATAREVGYDEDDLDSNYYDLITYCYVEVPMNEWGNFN